MKPRYFINPPCLRRLDTDLTKCRHIFTGEIFTRSVIGDTNNPFNHLQIGENVYCFVNKITNPRKKEWYTKKAIIVGFIFSHYSKCWYVETKTSENAIRSRFYTCVRKAN